MPVEILAGRGRKRRRVGDLRLWTLGIGAMASPRFAPAGLLVERSALRVMIDGGPAAEPAGRLAAWLVTDEASELMPRIRDCAQARGLVPYAGSFRAPGLRIQRRRVVHTNHPTFAYLILANRARVVWAPEFLKFPAWAANATLVFAEASSWSRPIRFRAGVGGHLDVLAVAKEAQRHRVRRLVFAHIGRPTIRALDRGESPPFGEFGAEGRCYLIRGRSCRSAAVRHS
jgi:hypothetical protein